MDIMIKTVVLVVIGMIILLTLRGEFGPRPAGGRRARAGRRGRPGSASTERLLATHP